MKRRQHKARQGADGTTFFKMECSFDRRGEKRSATRASAAHAPPAPGWTPSASALFFLALKSEVCRAPDQPKQPDQRNQCERSLALCGHSSGTTNPRLVSRQVPDSFDARSNEATIVGPLCCASRSASAPGADNPAAAKSSSDTAGRGASHERRGNTAHRASGRTAQSAGHCPRVTQKPR